jgi:catechol 2,3-dioxygenase-like lactoylglutathione lyase family enzyme
MVSGQAKAHDFYTEVLGFVVKNDIQMGEARWLTVVSPTAPDGPELLLEPMGHGPLVEAAHAWQSALRENGIPAAMFGVDDVDAEFARITALGHEFESAPASAGPVRYARIHDGCGNLIQLTQFLG